MARQRRGKMKTVVLEVRSLRESLADIVRVVKMRGGDHEARISFASPELLWQVLTAKRWEILKAMCGVGPMSIRDAARRVERDVKAVHSDVTALLTAVSLPPPPYTNTRAEGCLVSFTPFPPTMACTVMG